MIRPLNMPSREQACMALAGLAILPLMYLGNPGLALLAGAGIVLAVDRSLPFDCAAVGRLALQTAIVLLGFKLNAADILTLGREHSLTVTTFVICSGAVGLVMARLMRLDVRSGMLISSGTAICGGTTIASLSPLIGATAAQTGVAMGLVFLLNATALLVFPLVGEYLGLSQAQFGLWAALAIHDTSSVVATATLYGDEAQTVATTIKLGRTLWLIPVVLIAGMASNRQGPTRGTQLPVFVVLFVAAAVVNSMIPIPSMITQGAGAISRLLLVLALFAIGMEIRRATLRSLSGRVVAHALLLWILVVPSTLLLAMYLG